MAGENGTASGAASALETKIINQIEYYFGDINLPRDRFLQDQITQDDGWVTLETMLKFNRLKKLSDDHGVICAALKKSASGLMEVAEDNTKIRRSLDKPMPDNTKERREEVSARCVYAKGFPEDRTLDELQEFFNKQGEVESISMRRIPKTKDFKGSVFVVFANKEDAEKFVKAESLKYGETELIRSFKEDYFKRKNEEKRQAKKQHNDDVKEKEKEQDDKIRDRIRTSTILRLDGLPGNITLEDLRNFFSDFGTVAWVDHDNGETKGYVRFTNENEATEVLTKAKEAGEGKIEINNNEVTARVLDGEEELNHWKMIFKTMEDQRRTRNKPGGFRGGKRRNNQYGGRGKRSFNKDRDGDGESKDSGEPAAKVVKTEDD
ncbi:lupus La protein-like isoform X2 [Haliotis rubra]|nr:lupus La protein-like isoform X2 [Haliotis rubra]XP_046556003.1 lupus La protein-like isoform X2 [Haliotis rubra]